MPEAPQNPYQQLYNQRAGQMPAIPAAQGVSFTEDEIEVNSNRVDDGTDKIMKLAGQTGQLGLPSPGFGVVGKGCEKAHNKAIEAQIDALSKGHKALHSWKESLRKAAANYRTANQNSAGPFGDMPNVGPAAFGGGPAFPGTGMPGTGMPGSGLPGAGMPGTDMPRTELPRTELPKTEMPKTDMPGTGMPKTDMPNTDMPKTDMPNTGMPGSELPGAGMPGAERPDMRVPDIDSALNGTPRTPDMPGSTLPDQTDLARFDPPPGQTPGLSGLPNQPALPDQGAPGTKNGTGTGAGTSIGIGTGTGAGGGAGAATAATLPAGLRSANTNGMPMMPFMPMTGAGGGTGDTERERDGVTLLPEDEGVWGGDEDVAPEVLGREV